MPSQRRPGLASIHIYVLPEVKAEFAAATKRKGESMTTALTRLIRSYTKRSGPRLRPPSPHARSATSERPAL